MRQYHLPCGSSSVHVQSAAHEKFREQLCLQARIPSKCRVLLCTTTNKAIDSLADKMKARGIDNILAFGNTARMGTISQSVTLRKRCEQHSSVKALKALKKAKKAAQKEWNKIVEMAEKRPPGQGKHRDKGTCCSGLCAAVLQSNLAYLQCSLKSAHPVGKSFHLAASRGRASVCLHLHMYSTENGSSTAFERA